MSQAEDAGPNLGRIGAGRIAIGLAQGLALFALSEAGTRHVWPATAPGLLAALTLALLFGPLVILGGLGRVRPPVLAITTFALAGAVGWMGWHDIARDQQGWRYTVQNPMPGLPVFVFGAALVFIGHHLVAPADAARRWIAPYAAYFDAAWKDAVQLVLSAAFVGLFWAALGLGAALFQLIGIKAFGDIITQRGFVFPVTAVAFAAAVQLTDVRLGLILGIRTVGLALLSWLLPLMTLIGAAFLLALPFTGLRPLFATRNAAEILLGASAALIVLINTAYQDGEPARTRLALRHAARVASVCLVPLTAIAAYAIFKRVDQYGWTPERIEAAACALIGAGYAATYTIAAVGRFGPWMRLVERTNVILALAALTAILVLFTPIADPARLSVADQVARLLNGQTPPERFDYAFLRSSAARYGREALAALQGLKGGPRQLAIAQRATASTKETYTADAPPLPLAQRLTVYPAGAALPAGFAEQKIAAWKEWTHSAQVLGSDSLSYRRAFGRAGCLVSSNETCDAYLIDIDGDRQPELLIASHTESRIRPVTILSIFKRDAAGQWPGVGELTVTCPETIATLELGHATPERVDAYDLVIGGLRYKPVRNEEETCVAQPSGRP